MDRDIGEQAIDAMVEVCKMIPTWVVPREFVARLYYDRRVAIEAADGGLDKHIDKLGYHVRERFHSRRLGTFNGELLADTVFLSNDVEEYVRLIDWSRSFRDGKLRLLY